MKKDILTGSWIDTLKQHLSMMLRTGGVAPAADDVLTYQGSNQIEWKAGTDVMTSTYHWVRVTHDVDQTIANATWTALAFNTERWDPSGLHDTVTNNSRITIPADAGGLWMFGGNAEWDHDAANTTRYMGVRINGNAAMVFGEVSMHAAFTGGLIHAMTSWYVLSGSDYVELIVRQFSGGNLDIMKNNLYSPEFFAIGPFAYYT